jgi:hypothetical protein
LIATSRKPDAQPRFGAQKLSIKVRGHFASGCRVRGNSHGPRFTLIEMGLIVLVVSTTWAIASVSVWWVPVYFALLVMIFITPRARQLSPPASESVAASDGIGITDLGQGLRVDRADGAEQYRPVTRSDSDLTSVDSAESSDSGPDLTGAGTAKLRRGRIRARKVSKPATELVPDSLPIAWIQVRPGKFVRIEGGIKAADTAQTEEVVPWDHPDTETPAHATPAVAVQAEPLPVQDPLESPETSPCDAGPVLVSTGCALGSVTDEHGIAPSTVSLDLRLKWVSRVQRGNVHAVPRVDRASWRRNIRAHRPSRSLVRSWFAPNTPRQNAAHRAFGRMTHVHRTPQPRSPPGCYGW